MAVQFVYPDDDGHAHVVFSDGRRSIPILTKGAAERVLIVALMRELMTIEEAAALYPQIDDSNLPNTNWLGEVVQNPGLMRTGVVLGSSD